MYRHLAVDAYNHNDVYSKRNLYKYNARPLWDVFVTVMQLAKTITRRCRYPDRDGAAVARSFW